MTIGVIPARWGSKRFPGKLLANIAGKSLIQRTYENASRAKALDILVVATDDERIFQHVKEFGGEVVMTAPTCPTGTDRMGEAVDRHFPEAKIAINIQGDEPCVSPETIDILIEMLKGREGAVLTTPVTKIAHAHDVFDSSIVKCVFNRRFEALYFSRHPIPYPQNREVEYYRHLGIYCFKCDFLRAYRNLPSSFLQECEDLEQLKVLEHGYPIHVCVVDEKGIGVDKPEDVEKLEEILCRENISLSQEALSPH